MRVYMGCIGNNGHTPNEICYTKNTSHMNTVKSNNNGSADRKKVLKMCHYMYMQS